MAEGRETFSPNNAIKGHPRDSNRRGELTQARVYRGDGGHIANHVGKGARTNPRLRADFGETNVPVQGGHRDVIE
jgi:hypothetical protein